MQAAMYSFLCDLLVDGKPAVLTWLISMFISVYASLVVAKYALFVETVAQARAALLSFPSVVTADNVREAAAILDSTRIYQSRLTVLKHLDAAGSVAMFHVSANRVIVPAWRDMMSGGLSKEGVIERLTTKSSRPNHGTSVRKEWDEQIDNLKPSYKQFFKPWL